MQTHFKQDKDYTWCRQMTMMPNVKESDQVEKCTCVHCLVNVIERSNVYNKVQGATERLEHLQHIINANTGG